MSFDDEDVEQVLTVIKLCYVYKIPPRQTAHGYRAADWDLSSPMWTGRCVVSSEGDICRVKLEDPNTGELFATCPVTDSAIEPVNDSSRYYVVKIEDGSGRHAFIGMGFAERNEAFDFSSTLQDHAKYIKQKKDSALSAKKAETQPKVDYSLPQGVKIHVELKNKKPASSSSNSTSNSSGGLLLPPPPGSRGKSTTITPPSTNNQTSLFDNSFGNDFFSTSNQQQFQQQQQFQSFQSPQQQQQNQFGSNDVWGDFTGSVNQSSNQQNNLNFF